MAMTSLNISIPVQLKAYIEAQVQSGDYGTPSEYVRSLVRKDKESRLEELKKQLLAALQTEAFDVTEEEWERVPFKELLLSKTRALQEKKQSGI
ncbi:MAG: type II toxin-antitoxin system ParD family antitoxin [Acidobacteriaceae bacterium]|nr:type II toxin-antitoxin system ParD family antitoxin [Acidobacteriaceae bacterium]